jgi:hypothetical protein
MNSQRDLQIQRSGGPARVVGYEPVFSVVDVARAVEHYERLGFRAEYHDGAYAFAHFRNLTVHLTHDDDPEHHTTSVLYIHVDDADRLAADWRRSGMTVDGPRNEDYGKREGRHVDPGPQPHPVRFTHPTATMVP